MDSKERDQRSKDGFSERGDSLYDAGNNDERKEFRKERTRKRKEKDIKGYDPRVDEAHEKNPDNVKRKVDNAKEYGSDDEEAADIEELPEEEEEDIFDEEDEP